MSFCAVRLAAWRILLLASLSGISAALYNAVAHRRAYDYEESRRKLLEIGRSVQVYRQYHLPKPVRDRRTGADAGLPANLLELATPGKPWSVLDGLACFRVKNPLEIFAGTTNFSLMYYADRSAMSLPTMSQYYALRGERLPILVDFNMNSLETLAQTAGTGEALILRLDGTVERKQIQLTNRNRIWEE